jgi:hypothetical protein
MNPLFRLVSEGDSISANAANPSHVWKLGGLTAAQIPGANSFASYSPQTFAFKAGDIVCVNRAIAGSRLKTNGPTESYPGDLTFRTPTWTDALVADDPPGSTSIRYYIFTVMIGSNPDTIDPAKAAADLQQYLQARVAAGYSGIVVGTILSRGDGIIANFEAYRQGYNAILRTPDWQNAVGAQAFALSDFGNEPTIGAANACFDSTLFSDKIHPTDLGYTYMSPLYAIAVAQVKNTIAIAAAPAPAILMGITTDGARAIYFNGTLEQSSDMTNWQEVDPQPQSPYRTPADTVEVFYRATSPLRLPGTPASSSPVRTVSEKTRA